MKTTLFLCFLLGHLGLALGQGPQRGDTRVIMMVSDADDCKNYASCYGELIAKAKTVIKNKDYQDLTADSSTTASVFDGDGHLRGRQLCDQACVERYGYHICVFYGWCRRRELAATEAEKEDFFNDMDHSNCWTYQGLEYDAKFMSLMPGELSDKKLKTKGVSFRTQIYNCD